MAKAAQAACMIDDTALVPARKLSVLYAEDQVSARVVTTALLRKLGYVVDAVEDGELALQKAMATPYDIILLDIEMPVMDGVTAARRIRAESDHCRNAPILALSAYLADTTEDSGWRSLFDCAVPKPATRNELETALGKAHEFRQPVHPVQNLTFRAFRNTLPRIMWARLVERAVEDMHELALTATACAAASDPEGLNQSRQALKALAGSFGADDVLAAAEGLARDSKELSGRFLVAAIADWAKLASH